MHDTTSPFGHARTHEELRHERYLDALVGFRPFTCLSMTQTGTEGAGAGGDGGAGGTGDPSGGAGAGSGSQDPQGGSGSGQGADGREMATDGDGKSLGYPKDTPVAEMTPQERDSYHAAKRREQQAKNQQWRTVTGDRTPEQLQADLDELAKLRTDKLTPADQALAAAREEGRSAAIATERQNSATAIFRGALESIEVPQTDGTKLTLSADEIDDLTTRLNVGSFITNDGVDASGIAAFAKRFTPATGASSGTTRPRDFGGGSRPERPGDRGAGGKAMAEKRFGSKTK